jgi:hypothetical protein
MSLNYSIKKVKTTYTNSNNKRRAEGDTNGYRWTCVTMTPPWITPTNSIPPQKGSTTDHLSPDTGEAAVIRGKN